MNEEMTILHTNETKEPTVLLLENRLLVVIGFIVSNMFRMNKVNT